MIKEKDRATISIYTDKETKDAFLRIVELTGKSASKILDAKIKSMIAKFDEALEKKQGEKADD